MVQAEARHCIGLFQSQANHAGLFDVREMEVKGYALRRPGFPLKKQNVLLNIEKYIQDFDQLTRGSSGRMIRQTLFAQDGSRVEVYRIHRARAKKRVLISAGVHGDEALGSVVALDLAKQILRETSRAYNSIEFIFIPLVNKEALRLGYRYLREEGDYNRAFHRDGPAPPRVKSIVKELEDIKIDLHLDLHQSMSSSHFFVIRMDRDDSGLSEFGVRSMEESDRMVLSDYKPFRIKPTPYKEIEPGVMSSSNPGTFKSFTSNRGAISITVEAPGLFPVKQAREIYLQLVQTLVDAI